MLWETLGIDGHWPKVLAVVATLVTICSGGITIIVWVKTWSRRRLKMLKEYIDDREADASARRPHLLAKISSSLYSAPPPGEPNVSKHVEDAIQLLDLHKVSRAQSVLEDLQDQIAKKIDFIERYGADLARHQANVSLFLAAIADRRNDPRSGLKHISDAKAGLGDDLEVLKYEGLLHLKAGNWTEARDAFKSLEDEATWNETRHYKAIGAKGRGDALVRLEETGPAIEAYGRALKRIGEAEPQHRDPIFVGVVHVRLAELQEQAKDIASAGGNAANALKAFGSANGLGVPPDDLKAAKEIKARADAALKAT